VLNMAAMLQCLVAGELVADGTFTVKIGCCTKMNSPQWLLGRHRYNTQFVTRIDCLLDHTPPSLLWTRRRRILVLTGEWNFWLLMLSLSPLSVCLPISRSIMQIRVGGVASICERVSQGVAKAFDRGHFALRSTSILVPLQPMELNCDQRGS